MTATTIEAVTALVVAVGGVVTAVATLVRLLKHEKAVSGGSPGTGQGVESVK